MKAQQLRNSILQYAMQGKLVPQNPNDEPASVLLEKIKEEKEQLIQNKVIKCEKALSPISDDEIPFEIPESWEWVKLGDISKLIMGQSPPGKSVSSDENGIEFHQGKTNFSNMYLNKSDSFTTEGNKIASSNAVLLSVRAPVGAVNITERKICIGRGLCAIESLCEIENKFYFYFVRALEKELIKKATGTTFIAVTAEVVKNLTLPLPPLAEQKRIVARIEELFEKVDKYDVLEQEITALNNSFPTDMEKSILQYAMQGKLVDQDPNDEPASVLLERIKEEKEQLIKDKVIKREKALPPITDDEIPFEIPDSWKWVRLGEIITLISGRDLTTSEYNDRNEGIPYLTGASNFDKNNLIINRWTPNPKVISKQNDLLITCKGTIGEMVIQDIEEAHIARQVMAIRPFSYISNSFLKSLLTATVNELKSNAKSMIPGISRDDILQIKTPLPPLAEQKRIVAKIEEMLELTSKMKNNLIN